MYNDINVTTDAEHALYIMHVQHQCCRFSQYIGYVTPKIVCLYYKKTYLWGKSISKMLYLMMKTKSLFNICE